jgi:membrane associated rhomboid family serine protease
MRRTNPLDLLAPFFIIGIAAYVLLRFSYDSIPPLGYVVPVPLAALAVAELVIARRVRAAVRHDPRARPITAIAIARCVALGKASAVVAAGVAGCAAALLVRVAPDAGTVDAAAHDTRVSAFLGAASVVLAIAGLVLERSGIDPNRDRTDRPGAAA